MTLGRAAGQAVIIEHPGLAYRTLRPAAATPAAWPNDADGLAFAITWPAAAGIMACVPRKRRTACKQCARPIAECGNLSQNGLCRDCGASNAAAAAAGMAAKAGDHYERWLRSNGPRGRPRTRVTPL